MFESVDHCSCYSTKPVSPDIGKVLVGFEVPPAEKVKFNVFLESLKEKNFTYVEETENPVYKDFLHEE